METFTFTPDYGISKSVKPRVTTISFGDGYAQRFAKGLNTQPQNWDLRFSQREAVDSDAIEAFLQARGGTESFEWTPPDAVDPIFVICAGYSKTIEKYNRYSISCVFEQVFSA